MTWPSHTGSLWQSRDFEPRSPKSQSSMLITRPSFPSLFQGGLCLSPVASLVTFPGWGLSPVAFWVSHVSSPLSGVLQGTLRPGLHLGSPIVFRLFSVPYRAFLVLSGFAQLQLASLLGRQCCCTCQWWHNWCADPRLLGMMHETERAHSRLWTKGESVGLAVSKWKRFFPNSTFDMEMRESMELYSAILTQSFLRAELCFKCIVCSRRGTVCL